MIDSGFYSKLVQDYASREYTKVIIPDLILKKESVACGDYIILSGEIDEGIVMLNCSSVNSCILSRAMCNYINVNLNNKELTLLEMEVNSLYNQIIENEDVIFELFEIDSQKLKHRFDCLFSPLKLLKNFLEELKTIPDSVGVRTDTLSNLECDACVGACKIDWKKKDRRMSFSVDKKEYPIEYLSKWLRFGKLHLSEKEKEDLAEVCVDVSDEEFQFLSDRTINTFVLKNLHEAAPRLVSRKWKPAAYLIQKNEITRGHVQKVCDFIKDNKLNIYFVKGYVTQKYYDYPSIRIHSDYDLIATNSGDAFALTHHLLKDGFRIRPHLFSYKKISMDGKEMISGHFHMQKIIDDTYMLEMDISFPGFLLNRINLFFPKYEDTRIAVEDQIVITLLHLFKHSHIFMKDINDLFYMLNAEDVDFEYLKDTLSSNKITEYFNLAFMFIYKNYCINKAVMDKYIEVLELDTNIIEKYPNWPYDESEHLKIKMKDYKERIINTSDEERCFLSPVAMFKDTIDITKVNVNVSNKNDENIGKSIRKFNYEGYSIYLTCFGVFINYSLDTNIIDRTKLIGDIEKFLEKIGVDSIFNIPYATDSFYVRNI